MKEPNYEEALIASTKHPDLMVMPVTTGLINQTYKVTIKANGFRFLLQQINGNVFSSPEKVQANYKKIWDYLFYQGALKTIPYPVTVPKPLPFADDSFLFRDSQMQCWRKMEFKERAQTFAVATNLVQARSVAQTFGSLTAHFESFDLDEMHNTIPRFHDLSYRFQQFTESLRSRNYERLLKAARLIEQLKRREHYVSFYEVITESEEFKTRLMHHDAKISNILFDEETGRVICPVDLDTCMPGYFFSDLGDMIRSMAGSEEESNRKLDEIVIRNDFYKAIVAGYLEVMSDLLSDPEKKYIHCSGLLIIYMQALRFLTDYLNGDLYYKTDYPEENFNRTTNQLTLLKRLEEFLLSEYQFKL